MKGIQGATGNWVGSFWLADRSTQACALRAPVTLDLLDDKGVVQLSAATSSFAPLPLSANTAMPVDNTVTSGQLAFIALEWPTDANAAGAINGKCPMPDFVPTAVQITFADSGPILARNAPVDDRQITVCGDHILQPEVGPLEPSL